MIKVFFRGYGCWYFEHRRSGGTYSISLTDRNRFILFPSSPEKVDFKSSSRSIQSIGFFYLSREDAFEYRHTKNHSTVRKLYPSSQYHSNATFTKTSYSFFKDIFDSTITKITDQVEIGGLRINAEDCYLLIDIEQPFVFQVEEPDEPTSAKPIVKTEATAINLDPCKMLMTILGMAMDKYGHDTDNPKIKIYSDINARLMTYDILVSDEDISDCLTEAGNLYRAGAGQNIIRDTKIEIEQNILLRIIIGMAIDAYGYDPKASRNIASGDHKYNSIAGRLKNNHKINVNKGTIQKYLTVAENLLLPQYQ